MKYYLMPNNRQILLISWNFDKLFVTTARKRNLTDHYYRLRIFSIVRGKIYRISYFQLLVKFVRIRAIKQLLFDSPSTLRSIESRLVLSIFISAIVKTPTLVRFLLKKIRGKLLIVSHNSDKKDWSQDSMGFMIIIC